jgi:hypothetical protein
MMRLCGYNSIKSMRVTARTGSPANATGARNARYFKMGKEDLNGSEAR